MRSSLMRPLALSSSYFTLDPKGISMTVLNSRGSLSPGVTSCQGWIMLCFPCGAGTFCPRRQLICCMHAGEGTRATLVSSRLPANALVLRRAFGALRAIEVDEVDDDLLGPQIGRQPLLARRLVAQDHKLSGAHHAFEVG